MSTVSDAAALNLTDEEIESRWDAGNNAGDLLRLDSLQHGDTHGVRKMTKRNGFAAVVESGSCDQTYTYWEERQNCGHLHKTREAAEECGKKHYAAKYVNGSWQASAAWHGYTVHDQDGRRVERAA